jgi:hypothetical protein
MPEAGGAGALRAAGTLAEPWTDAEEAAVGGLDGASLGAGLEHAASANAQATSVRPVAMGFRLIAHPGGRLANVSVAYSSGSAQQRKPVE